MADKKRSVEISVFSKVAGNKEHLELKGRFLGLIFEDELRSLVAFDSEKGLSVNKLFTSPSKPLKVLDETADEVTGLRMCFTVKEQEGKEAFEKRLFITEPLEIVNAFEPKNDGSLAHISTEGDDYIILKETVG